MALTENVIMPGADYQAACDAIREKTNTTDLIKSGDMAGLISGIKTGVVAVEESDVNFYDYDGTCLYSYTLAEAQALTELPPLPSHDGLVCQGWNWTLDEVKALDQFMVIGANYITDDGRTRLYISLEYERHLTIPLNIAQTVTNGVEIDWGDGSPVETIGGTGAVSTTHTYSQLGDYIVKLDVKSGSIALGDSGTSGVFGAAMPTVLRKVEFGSGFSNGVGVKAFYKHRRLESVTLPADNFKTSSDAFNGCCSLSGALVFSMKDGGTYLCYECSSLKVISFPKSQPYIPNSSVRECRSLKYVALYRDSNYAYSAVENYGLQNAYSLRKFELPDATTKLNTASFYNCASLSEFTIKANVTDIAANALFGCVSLAVLRFKPTTPPTVANANAFTNLPTDCIIEVPTGTLEAYTTATNYPSADTYTYVEVDV